jgi:hypothetical protein
MGWGCATLRYLYTCSNFTIVWRNFLAFAVRRSVGCFCTLGQFVLRLFHNPHPAFNDKRDRVAFWPGKTQLCSTLQYLNGPAQKLRCFGRFLSGHIQGICG